MSGSRDHYQFADEARLRVGLGMASIIGILSVIGAGLLLTMTLADAFTRTDFDPLQPVSAVFILLAAADLIQGIATTMNMKWALDGRLPDGTQQDPTTDFCRAQSVFEQVGDSGAALCITSICLLVLIRLTRPSWIIKRSRAISSGIVISICLILLLIILVPATTIPRYYGATGLWCWIQQGGTTRDGLRIGTEYALVWMAVAAQVLVYGYILIDKVLEKWWGRKSTFDSLTLGSAYGMLWYAIAYALEIIPVSVIRLAQFNSDHIPRGWDVLALIFLGSAGWVNALLWFATGRRFGFSDGRRTSSERSASDGNSDSDVPMEDTNK